MAKKTWKLGEYSKGGIISVETKKDTVTVIAKDCYTPNLKELDRITVNVNSYQSKQYLDEFLFNLTTSYYTDVIMKWIEEHSDINKVSY